MSDRMDPNKAQTARSTSSDPKAGPETSKETLDRAFIQTEIREALRTALIEAGVRDTLAQLQRVDLTGVTQAMVDSMELDNPLKKEELFQELDKALEVETALASLDSPEAAPEELEAQFMERLDHEAALSKAEISRRESEGFTLEGALNGDAATIEAAARMAVEASFDFATGDDARSAMLSGLAPLLTLAQALGSATLVDDLAKAEAMYRQSQSYRRQIFDRCVEIATADQSLTAACLSGIPIAEARKLQDQASRDVFPQAEDYLAAQLHSIEAGQTFRTAVTERLKADIMGQLMGTALESILNSSAAIEAETGAAASARKETARIYGR